MATTTVRSIPDRVFKAFLIIKSDRAKEEKREFSKNELYVEALTEYAEKRLDCTLEDA